MGDPTPEAAPGPSFADVVLALRARAEAGEGDGARAEACLRAAEGLERQAGQYRATVAGIKRSVPVGQRSGVRLGHLARALKRAVRDRDRFLSQAEAALTPPRPLP